MTDRLSPELQILVHAMRFVIQRDNYKSEVFYTESDSLFQSDVTTKPHATFGSTPSEHRHPTSEATSTEFPAFDPIRLMQLARYHKIRPILNEFNKSHQILDDKLSTQLSSTCSQIVIKNLKMVRLCHQIVDVLQTANIPVVPLKGNLFLQAFYQNQQLREMGDLDILIPPECMMQAMELLRSIDVLPDFGDDYSTHLTQQEYLQKQLDTAWSCETRFRYQSIHVDVHWNLSPALFKDHIRFNHIFKNAHIADFYGKKMLLPSSDHTLSMMILHHGGKENWMRFRHLVDLWYGIQSQSDTINFDNLSQSMSKLGCKRVMMDGLYLVNVLFYDKSNQNPEKDNFDTIIKLSTPIDLTSNITAAPTINQMINSLSSRSDISFTPSHNKLLYHLWERSAAMSYKTIFAKQVLRFMRRDNNKNTISYLFNYIRSVVSNRSK